MKRHIPNIITLGNLTCGLLALMYANSMLPWYSVYFIFGGLFLDFFDGFFARILKVDGELGKQLDSLADMVTFGVAPGFLMFSLLQEIIKLDYQPKGYLVSIVEMPLYLELLPLVAFLIPILSAVRLAKFNIASNQSDQFIGLPTPANAIFFCGIFYFVFENFHVFFTNEAIRIPVVWILIGLIVVFSLLLNANIPLIALKFKTFGWKGNEARFIFLGVALLAILTSLLISNIFVSIPIIILLYLIISIINNYTKKRHEI